jgi:hypothetical protein
MEREVRAERIACMIDWVTVEKTPDGPRILEVFKLALRGMPTTSIATETGFHSDL